MGLVRLCKSLIKFGLVGGSGAVIGWAILYVLVNYLKLNYMVAYVVAFVTSIFTNYIFNTYWTFGRKDPNPRGFFAYIMTSLFTLAITSGLMYILTTKLSMWYLLSAIIITFIGFPINYFLGRKLVWKG